jgi:hypothetical protein
VQDVVEVVGEAGAWGARGLREAAVYAGIELVCVYGIR